MAHNSYGAVHQDKAEIFYTEVLALLLKSKIPFLIGGTYAVRHYTGIDRPTKDFDIFCKAGDYPKILKSAADAGYKVSVEDERWLAKVYQKRFFVDIIFGSVPGVWPITDHWLEHAAKGKVLGQTVLITPKEELIVSKAFRMQRAGFDGADVTHLILKLGKELDWKHLLNRMDPYWEVLLVQILLFRFTYPSERENVPRWLLDELLHRLEAQLSIPTPKDKVSRGSILSWSDYRQAVKDWGFKDLTEIVVDEDR